jgi:predicted PurR-regulated permease PerM
MAVASLIPLGGTALIWGPGAILLWMQGRPGAAIFLALWGFVVVSFLADNVLRPFLIKGEGEQNTLVVFLGVFGGIPAFGLLGIFLGPLVLSLLFTLIETLRRIASPRPEIAPAEP